VADDDLRALERAAAGGDPRAREALRRARGRVEASALPPVESVAWRELAEVVREPERIPECLRALLDDTAEAPAALGWLGHSLDDQGLRGPANAAAIPYLLEVVRQRTQLAPEVLRLVVRLSVVDLDPRRSLPLRAPNQLLHGEAVDRAACQRRWEASVEDWEALDELRRVWQDDAYRAAARGAEEFVDLLDAPEPALVAAGAYAAPWYWDAAQAGVLRFPRALRAELDEASRATVSLAAGFLPADPELDLALQACFDASEAYPIRLTAGLALALRQHEPADEVLGFLLEVSPSDPRLLAANAQVAWDLPLAGLVHRVLSG